MTGVVLDACRHTRAAKRAVHSATGLVRHHLLLQRVCLAQLDGAEVHLGSETSHSRWSKVLLSFKNNNNNNKIVER